MPLLRMHFAHRHPYVINCPVLIGKSGQWVVIDVDLTGALFEGIVYRYEMIDISALRGRYGAYLHAETVYLPFVLYFRAEVGEGLKERGHGIGGSRYEGWGRAIAPVAPIACREPSWFALAGLFDQGEAVSFVVRRHRNPR